MEDQVFFVGQKAFINKGDEILTLTDPTLGMDFPGGKIQVDEENLEQSLKREIKEETGLEVEVGEPFVTWVHLMLRGENKGKKIFLVGYKCNFLSGEVRLSNEHDSFKWVSKENLKDADDNQEYFKYLEMYFMGA